ncbi:hypothetical protein CDEST_15331 [Colletotrichum destructivum]|uniref:Uncharacterized protein n=1 Tax=Colletotrichum destructivum TaxID=34406 RepID=A0AAX4J4Q5_9PEZI|nr:hypothetical protein CDEST_15331 [Colletotrichum destructivum]
MQRISNLRSNGHNSQGMNPGTAFQDLYAVNITSAPYNAQKGGWDYDGRVQIIGRNFLNFDPHGSHIISEDIATMTLAAFNAANYTPHGKS